MVFCFLGKYFLVFPYVGLLTPGRVWANKCQWGWGATAAGSPHVRVELSITPVQWALHMRSEWVVFRHHPSRAVRDTQETGQLSRAVRTWEEWVGVWRHRRDTEPEELSQYQQVIKSFWRLIEGSGWWIFHDQLFPWTKGKVSVNTTWWERGWIIEWLETMNHDVQTWSRRKRRSWHWHRGTIFLHN